MKSLLKNNIELNKDLVWELANKKQIDYTDGLSSECYLRKVLSKAQDLSSNSYELEMAIKDWPSEYHLTTKRAQLLSGFDFDKSKKVLEVGCGCGAITRFLGESFDEVIAVEGSLARAGLARMRTKDLKNVSILCAPFHEINFRRKFDLIFCIGVFEYSNVFVDADDPYDAVLKCFYDVLTPDGVIVIAIENQFGLKYFSSCGEDHTGIMYDGLEGYPRYGNKARTFGYDELKRRLKRYFASIDFYFPYPDYKIPSCVLSENFFKKAKLGELIGSFRSRDYLHKQKSFFDERFSLFELDKNGKLPFFSNSFLVVAGKRDILSLKFNQLGVLYSKDRKKELQTITMFLEDEDEHILVKKRPLIGGDKVSVGKICLNSCEQRWVNGLSLHSQIMKRVKEHNVSLDEIFKPCKIWLKKLKEVAYYDGKQVLLDGKYIDCIWQNCYIINGDCIFIDQEWEWYEKINIEVMVIRSIYIFLEDMSCISDLTASLKINRLRVLISDIASVLEITIDKKDFKKFYKLQSEISRDIFGRDFRKTLFIMWLTFINRALFAFIFQQISRLRKMWRRLRRLIFNFCGLANL